MTSARQFGAYFALYSPIGGVRMGFTGLEDPMETMTARFYWDEDGKRDREVRRALKGTSVYRQRPVRQVQ